MRTIIDASVAIKWFYHENDQAKAQTILQQIKTGEINILVPLLFFYEVGNVFVTKKERPQIIRNAFSLLSRLHFHIQHNEEKQIPDISAFAKKYELSFYDGVYTFLMKEKAYPFITADKKLYNKLKNHFSNIQLL